MARLVSSRGVGTFFGATRGATGRWLVWRNKKRGYGLAYPKLPILFEADSLTKSAIIGLI